MGSALGGSSDFASTAPGCPLCASTTLLPWRTTLVRCSSCSLILLPRATEAGYDVAMEKEWFDTPPPPSAWIRVFELLNNRRVWKRISSFFSTAPTLLEVGVGSGSFLAWCASRGVEAVGCDLSVAVATAASARSGVRVFHTPVAELPTGHTFDVVVMNHVLEHVVDPIRLLEDVRERLRPNGYIHVAVPNVTCFEAALPGWVGYQPYHLVYFGPPTLRRAIAAAGLEAVSVSTHESFSGWFLALLRTFVGGPDAAGGSQAQKRGGHSPIVTHSYRLAMALAGAITLPLRAVQAAIYRGDEVVAIARRAEPS